MFEIDPNGRVFEALANSSRRQLLFALLAETPQYHDSIDPIDLLSKRNAIDDLETIRLELRHVHLPKLADMGFIEWNRQSGTVSKGPNWEEIASLLQLIYEHPDELPDEWLSEPTPQ